MDAPLPMTSQRPYLLRAIHAWVVDNDMTPHLLVDATLPGVRVPPGVVRDGKVVLNIADRAVARLELGDDFITFSARFGGVSQTVRVPVDAVLAIYARETGLGMAMPAEPESETRAGVPEAPHDDSSPETDPPQDGPPRPRGGSHLRVVK